MLNWDLLLDEVALASVLPDEYAQFRRPIAGALAVFLRGLPEAHQAAVLAEQAALPTTATISERLAALARSCPVLHKLGQILARDRRLSPELRGCLQDLESLPPSLPMEIIENTLAQELGPLGWLGVTLLPPAMAEASVAVVLPFRLERVPSGQTSREGVFKLLKPGIEERLEQELELFEQVGSYLDQRCDDFRIPHLDYRETFKLVREKLRQECRLDMEQDHLVQARRVYDGVPRVLVPALLGPCTRRVTAMERVVGEKVTEHGLVSAAERRELAGLVTRTMIARPLFVRDGRALFHGDPHAGNLFLTRDGRLAILDWSLVGWLGEGQRTALAQIALAALALDCGQIIALLEALCDRQPVDRPALESVVRARLAHIRRGQFPGFNWLMGLLDEAVQTARLRVATDLLLFRKSLHMLEGVLADLGAGGGQIEEIFVHEFLGHFVAEWPERWLASPNSRNFATRLSNADLLRFVAGWPWAATRFWLDLGTPGRAQLEC